MKKCLILFLSLFPFICVGQPGYITTIAGNGTTGFSGDGGAATSAQLGQVFGVAVDNIGNQYLVDVANSRIRKVSVLGTMTTLAGGGTSMGDSIPATDANLNLGAGAIASDAYGNIYFTDGPRIRKLNAAGIVTTAAGMLTPGWSGDGGPATAAQLNMPHGICFDAGGNMYISEEGGSRIRKVSSGIITTIAGTGTAGFGGDGGPATSAQLNLPNGLCVDAGGNLYIADKSNYRIRKIDLSGTISTYAGNGTSGIGGDGGPAVAATLTEPSYVSVDNYGNLYLGNYLGYYGGVRKVNSSGVISRFAGSGFSVGEGVPATSTSIADVAGIAVDNFNNVYISDRLNYRVRKITAVPGSPTSATDSFSVYLNSSCTGLSISILPAHYSAASQVKTWFGDGTSQVNVFSSASGYAGFGHLYGSAGTYTIKHVLYNASIPVDSVQYTYKYGFCNTFQIGFYNDFNGNCIKDGGENILSQPITVEVDSNGVAIDTVATTSGLYYSAYGLPGDVYGFKIISPPAGSYVSCPSSGVVFDTLGGGASTKFIGLECSTSSGFDLGIHAIIPITGVIDQVGNIYVQNAYCAPVNATITLHYSPKYAGTPVPSSGASVSGNSITWNVSALSSTQSTPMQLNYMLCRGVTSLVIGDTVHSHFTIDPGTGDVDISNNIQIEIDTVRAGCDPNHIWVSPEGCMPAATSSINLKYTVNFENTGNDTAHNIYVLDTLSDYLDPSSMRMVMASHEMYVSKMDVAGHTILKFDFPNIKLLDSSHHGLCDGAFIYTINTKPGIPLGANVHGRAGIYFDVNDVVLTNTVENKKGCPNELEVSEPSYIKPTLYPNPVNDELVVKAEVGAFSSFTITNSIGQEIIHQRINGSQTRVNVKALTPGVYYVMFTGEKGKEVVKFVKE